MHPSTYLSALIAPLLVSAGSVLPESGLTKRDTIPGWCTFALGPRIQDYTYFDATQDAPDGHACVGYYHDVVTCNPWSIQDLTDCTEAVRLQLAKDGQFESTRIGRWVASFNLLTTAFADRNPIYFDHYFESAQEPGALGAGATTWYYQRDGNVLTVETSEPCP